LFLIHKANAMSGAKSRLFLVADPLDMTEKNFGSYMELPVKIIAYGTREI